MSDTPVRPGSEYSDDPKREFGRPGETFGDPAGEAARGHATLSDTDDWVNQSLDAVVSVLGKGPRVLGDIATATGIGIDDVHRLLDRLHQKGWAEERPDGRWRLTDGAPRWGPGPEEDVVRAPERPR
jgi:predicted Rossmann fold nucleotide-binding protein DprA/Smf involved in DNA uptake